MGQIAHLTVGIDPGTAHLGVVCLDKGKLVHARYYRRPFPAGPACWMAYADAAFEIVDALATSFPRRWKTLGIEGPSFGSSGAQVDQLACVRQALASAVVHRVPFDVDIFCIAPPTAKMSLAGAGNADKRAMVRMAAAQVAEFEPEWTAAGNPTKETETLADAIGVAVATVAAANTKRWEKP